jgi:non-canonical (house-cleaning) NTP pyrophosphatase
MTIGLYTSKRYIDLKKQAVEEAVAKLGIKAEIVHDESLERPSSPQQAFGFEELFQRTKFYAAEALKHENIDIGVGVENSLSFIYNANEWYYVICVALCTKEGMATASFTPGISVPEWMIKEVQGNNIKIDALTQRLAGEEDPVVYFSAKTLTRKDLLVPALLLTFSKLNLEKRAENSAGPIPG